MRAAGPGQSVLLLLDVIAVLKSLHVPYAIVGAVAASFHGVVRASLDADAVISLSSGRTGVSSLLDALHQAGLKGRYTKGDVRDPIGGAIAIEDRFHNRVDLLLKIRGMADAVFSRAVETAFMGERIRVISAEDFIVMKVFAGNTKDLSDAAGVLQVSAGRIDRALLKSLAQSYGKDTLRKLHALLERYPTKV